MYTYVPLSGSRTQILYIPVSSGNHTPYDGPIWVAVLFLGALYITLLYAWYKIYVELIHRSTGRDDTVMFVVFTLILFFTGFVATMVFI